MEHIKEEFKLLLLKDLSARLPYGVKIHLETPKYGELIGTLDAVYPTEGRVIVDNLDKAIAPFNVRYGGFKIEENKVKPYLRPRSSMTEEEKRHCFMLEHEGNIEHSNGIFYRSQDYLNSIHVAYRTIDGKDLFELGLALEAPEGMYDNEQNK